MVVFEKIGSNTGTAENKLFPWPEKWMKGKTSTSIQCITLFSMN